MARFVSSPFFGFLGKKFPTKNLVVTGLVIMIAGNIIYALAVDVWMEILGRVISGLGAGLLNVRSCNAF